MDGFFGEFNRLLDRFLTPAVKKIFLINVVVCLGLILCRSVAPGFADLFVLIFGQTARLAIRHLYVWQFLTYMFVHEQVLHLLFNMLALWFFAPALEERWGTVGFWKFYLTVGIGAGVVHSLISLATGIEAGPVIGASGAIYGVLLAYAAYYPDNVVYLWGVFPMKIKHLVIIAIVMEFLSTASGSRSGVSNLTHLSGLGIAYVYLALRHKGWDIRRWQWR